IGRVGAATGPGGTAVARQGAVATGSGTYFRSAGAVSGQGAYVRAGFTGTGAYFSKTWAAGRPGYWYPGRGARAAAWGAAPWGSVSSACGYPEDCTSYDYGTSAVYQDGQVYVDGESVGTAEQYADQAAAIAETGTAAEAPPEGDWISLGVFALVRGEE